MTTTKIKLVCLPCTGKQKGWLWQVWVDSHLWESALDTDRASAREAMRLSAHRLINRVFLVESIPELKDDAV